MKLPQKIIILAGIAAGMLFLQSCNQNNGFPRIFFPEAAPPPYDSTAAISDSTLSGGTTIYTLQQGSGPFDVVYRDQIIVSITGRTADGKIFLSSCQNSECVPNRKVLRNLGPVPVQKRVGRRVQTFYLIEGLRKGLLGMKKGEKRIIRVPPSRGFTNSETYKHGIKVTGKTLIYDVQLIRIVQ